MRVGYLTYGLDREPTGIGRYAVQLLRALVAMPRGAEIVVLATEREDRHGLKDLGEYHALPGCHLLPLLMTLGNLALTGAARRYRLDAIHDPNGVAPFLGPGLGTRRIVTIHDAFAYVCPDTHNRLDNWRYRWQLPIAGRRADAVITVSESSRRDLVRHLGLLPSRVRVVPEGVDPRFRPVMDVAERQAVLDRYRIGSRYLLYLGALNGRKNLSRLLAAFAIVRENHPDVTLVVGGKRQWQTTEMDQTFRRLRLHDVVHFTGYVDEFDLPALYSAATAFVFPSLYEGFGLPPLEAMACGTPVITSTVSSLPEVVGDAAVTVDPTDVAAIAAAIERVLVDEAFRAELRRRGTARAARFTWEGAARETLALYELVLNHEIERRERGAVGM
jgi:glycosyltransferase involved in cell wall biosynthesis